MRRERLPESLTLEFFQQKFKKLKPGESFVYHRGHLGERRCDDSDLDGVASAAWRLASELGLADLVQRVNCHGSEYYIIKRHVPVPPPPPLVQERHVVLHRHHRRRKH